ncbi:hypothetical protein ARMGADRAFT_1032705 [Armillaria gallica]|uniref:Uncharacterized protein n=1 Tax=Armillaria gallica TaxID=47427 RepID=A0A2H3DPE2_ARMGA|nr:hypothetical protein ARMGADRAFT_1032705 [Armillaria gallica]
MLVRTGIQVAYSSGDEGKIEECSGSKAGMWHCCLFRMDGCGLKIILKAVGYLMDNIAKGLEAGFSIGTCWPGCLGKRAVHVEVTMIPIHRLSGTLGTHQFGGTSSRAKLKKTPTTIVRLHILAEMEPGDFGHVLAFLVVKNSLMDIMKRVGILGDMYGEGELEGSEMIDEWLDMGMFEFPVSCRWIVRVKVGRIVIHGIGKTADGLVCKGVWGADEPDTDSISGYGSRAGAEMDWSPVPPGGGWKKKVDAVGTGVAIGALARTGGGGEK